MRPATPLPFKKANDLPNGFDIVDAEDGLVAVVMEEDYYMSPETVQNGEFLIHAANLHHELVEALGNLLTRLHSNYDQQQAAADQAKIVLAKCDKGE